jgi:hypothetical protein
VLGGRAFKWDNVMLESQYEGYSGWKEDSFGRDFGMTHRAGKLIRFFGVLLTVTTGHSLESPRSQGHFWKSQNIEDHIGKLETWEDDFRSFPLIF